MQQDNATNLIKELGLDNLSDEQKDQLILKLAETLQNRIFAVLMFEMTDDEKNELNNMVDNSSDEQIADYLKQKFPDLDNITRQEYEKIRAEMLETKEDFTKLLNQQNQ